MTLPTLEPVAAAPSWSDVGVLTASAHAPGETLTGFVGLTGLVIAGFLVLARLSQGAVDDADASVDAPLGEPSDESVDTSPDETGGRGFDGANEAEGEEGHAPPDDDATPASSAPEAPPDPIGPESLPPGALLLNVALTQGLFGAILAGGAVYFEVPTAVLGMTGDGISTGPEALAVGVGFGLALWVGNEVASGLAAAVGAEYDEGLRELLAPEGTRAWVILLGATLPMIALVEEFIFRAAAIGATGAALPVSVWALAALSSIAFALGHGAQGRVGIVVTGGLGFALAAGFVLTESLLAVVIAHYLVNALEFVVHEGLGLPDPIWS